MNRPPVIIIQLIHISGPMKGDIQKFSEGFVTIGRHSSCHLRFPTDLTCVSRNHAEIAREGNQFKLTDRSSNGTLVNGKQVNEVYLKNGDILEFSKGGPKVSFLTEILETPLEPEKPIKAHAMGIPQEGPQPVIKKRLIQSARDQPEEISDQKTSKALIIQYGATIQSFNSLPVTLGKNPTCEFRIDKPSLFDLHAQFFFSQNQYWIKDLTGHKCILINHQPIGLQAPLTVNDIIALTYHGPIFRYVGEGRLIEIVEPPDEKLSVADQDQRKMSQPKGPEGVLSKFRKYLDEKLK